MRHPVSSCPPSGSHGGGGAGCVEEGQSPSVFVDVVGGAGLPAAPEDADPGASQDAHGVGVIAPTSASVPVDGSGPGMGVAGVVGPSGEGLTKPLVAGEAAGDAPVFAGGVGDGGDPAFAGELILGSEAKAIVAELGEDLSGIDGSGPGERLEDRAIGVLGEVGGDEAVEVTDLDDHELEDGGETADELALGLALEFLGVTRRGGAETIEELRGGATAAVRAPLEEALQSLLSEAGRAGGGGIAVEEGKGDRTVDVGEDDGGAGPEALQKATKLIGELDARGHQVVTGAHGGAQSLGGVGRNAQRPKAVAVGAEEVGEDVRVAGVALAERGAVAGTCGLERVGVDGHHREARLDERVDQQAGRSFDGDGQALAIAEAPQLAEEIGQSLRGVRDDELCLDGASRVQDADVVFDAGPVDADEVTWRSFHAVPPKAEGFLRSGVGRTCRRLTDRRSGLQVPWRNTLSSVWAFRAGRRSGSHAGRLAASELGSLHPDAEASSNAVNLPRLTPKVDQ